jgi:hypothetical protein
MERTDNSKFTASIVPVCTVPKEEETVPQPLDALWRRNLLEYNPLLDSSTKSYVTAPRVMKHLIKQGFLTNVSKTAHNDPIVITLHGHTLTWWWSRMVLYTYMDIRPSTLSDGCGQ